MEYKLILIKYVKDNTIVKNNFIKLINMVYTNIASRNKKQLKFIHFVHFIYNKYNINVVIIEHVFICQIQI